MGELVAKQPGDFGCRLVSQRRVFGVQPLDDGHKSFGHVRIDLA